MAIALDNTSEDLAPYLRKAMEANCVLRCAKVRDIVDADWGPIVSAIAPYVVGESDFLRYFASDLDTVFSSESILQVCLLLGTAPGNIGFIDRDELEVCFDPIEFQNDISCLNMLSFLQDVAKTLGKEVTFAEDGSDEEPAIFKVMPDGQVLFYEENMPLPFID